RQSTPGGGYVVRGRTPGAPRWRVLYACHRVSCYSPFFVSNSELTLLSASQMAGQVRQQKVSPVTLVEAHLARIDELNPKINAFVHVNAERALDEALEREAAVTCGGGLGRLHGVPISIKCSVDVAGMTG